MLKDMLDECLISYSLSRQTIGREEKIEAGVLVELNSRVCMYCL